MIQRISFRPREIRRALQPTTRPRRGSEDCENRPIADLLDKRLAFVMGKGGVGKTTVAYALARVAAARGKRVVVCEIAAQERGTALFGRSPAGYSETRLSKRLWSISIDPERTVREYLELELPIRAMREVLLRSRIFNYLTAATPGLREMLTVGKVCELALERRKARDARNYDLVIVDAPATGHGVALLRTPTNFRELAGGGPLAGQAGKVEATLLDHDVTGIAIVATGEEMAVNESIALQQALGNDFAIDRVLANGLYPERFTEAERELLERALAESTDPAGELLEGALAEARRARAQREQIARLRDLAGAAVTELPFLFSSEIGIDELDELAEKLA